MKKLLSAVLFCFLIAQSLNAQWQPDVRLTNNPQNSNTSMNNAWCIAASGLFLHVVWFDSRDGNWEIYYKRSTDAGVSWGADMRLTDNISESRFPSVTVSGAVVHVVWFDLRDGANNYEIYHKRSTDNGESWGPDTRLTNNPAFSVHPSVSASGTAVHVVWHDSRTIANYEIYYKRSFDGGVNWGADTRLTNIDGESTTSSVMALDSIVHVVWQDNRHGANNYEIYYKRSHDEGASWGADVRMTNNDAISSNPSVAASGSAVHVVWYDLRDGDYEIYYKRSPSRGVSWGVDTRLTNSVGASYTPSVAVSDSVVHVVWQEFRDGNAEIYYKRSADEGLSWGADTRLTDKTASSGSPSVAASGTAVHVVWEDLRDVNSEIYYKRDPAGGVTGVEQNGAEIQNEFKLFQNHPNPFHSATTISFNIPTQSLVSLSVFDAMGREVANLFAEELGVGSYSKQWNASGLSSGVYYFRLSAGYWAETLRMAIVH